MAKKETPTKSDQNSSPAAATPGGGELDHIRDILFGNQAREVDVRLNDLETQLAALRRELLEEVNNRVEQTADRGSTQLSETRKALTQQLQQQAEEHAAQLQLQKTGQTQQINSLQATLAERIETATADLQKQLRDTRKELTDSLNKLNVDVTERMQAMQSELRQRDDDLRQELLTMAAWLDERKATRADLGQMLVNLGQQLQTATTGDDEKDEPAAE